MTWPAVVVVGVVAVLVIVARLLHRAGPSRELDVEIRIHRRGGGGTTNDDSSD